MRAGTIHPNDCGNCAHWVPWTDEDWEKYCFNHYEAFGNPRPSKRYDFGWCDKIPYGTKYDGKYTYDGYSFADECYDESMKCFEKKEAEDENNTRNTR